MWSEAIRRLGKKCKHSLLSAPSVIIALMVKGADRLQQFRRWVIEHRKLLLVGGAVVVLLSIAVQLIYPYGRALPFASVAGQSVGFKKEPEITLTVQNRFADAEIELQAGNQTKSDKLQYFGARVNANAMAKHATQYPMLFRFIPFSILWYQPHLDRYQLSFAEDRLESVASEYAKVLSIESTDANLTIEEGELAVTGAEAGSLVSDKAIIDTIKTSSYSWDKTSLDIPVEVVEPLVSDASVESVRRQAEAILAQDITVTVDGKTEFKPNRSEIAAWLKLTNDAETNSVKLDFDQKAISEYVAVIANKTDDKPEPVQVKLVDGEESSRSGGKAGLGIDRQEVTEQIAANLELPQANGIRLSFDRQNIKPPLAYDRSYTSSEKGLRAYVEFTASQGDIHIAVTQLDGRVWSAKGNADESIASASTYKPMLMLRVLEDIERKDLKWDDKINGETIRDCFEDMIVVSANECAEALIEKYGVGPLTSYLREEEGFSTGTGFTFKEVTQTTAADLNKLMIGIENGQMIKGQYRNMMLEKMGRQIYRQGIPAGTAAPVYDKVGFLWDYIHDSAIVRHPKGTYTLVIMTKGESWGKVAEITKQIERILYG